MLGVFNEIPASTNKRTFVAVGLRHPSRLGSVPRRTTRKRIRPVEPPENLD